MNTVDNVVWGVDFKANKHPVARMYESMGEVMWATWLAPIDYTIVINSIFSDAIADANHETDKS